MIYLFNACRLALTDFFVLLLTFFLQVVSMLSEISKVFCLKMSSQVLALESSTMSKFIQRCKLLVAKNRDNLVVVSLLLLAIDFAIINFYDQWSY